MKIITKHLLNSFFQSFFSLFFILFFLVTVITFIRMSNFTSSFTVSFSDLFQLYLYLLPEMMTYVLPVTYFISLTMAIYKMSKDNESIILFAMSMSPKKISKIFFIISLFLSFGLILNTLILIPISDQLSKNFLQQKKLEAKINIKSNEFGQKFTSWNIFINKLDSNKKYKDLVMCKIDTKNNTSTFIIADSANIGNNHSLLEFTLKNGSVYDIKQEELKQIDYDKLKLTYKPEMKEIKSDDIFEYWYKAFVNKKRARNLAQAISIALFPFITYLFAISFGIVNTRSENSYIYLNIFLVIIIFYTLISQAASKTPFIGTGVVLTLFYISSQLLFYKKVLSRY